MFIFKLFYDLPNCPNCKFKLIFKKDISLDINDLDFEKYNEYFEKFVYIYCHICKFKQSFNISLTKSN